MKPAALLIGFVILVLGLIGLFVPERLVPLSNRLITPQGLYFAMAFRLAIGVVLLRAAPDSRAPTALRVLGWLVIVSGVITPFIGVERARAMVDWWTARGQVLLRLWAAVAIAFGGFILYAVRGRRR
jgi:hypothetical protein